MGLIKRMIFALLLCGSAQAQDSISMRITRIETAINYTSSTLRQSGKNFNGGLVLNVVGGGILLSSCLVKDSSTKNILNFSGGFAIGIGTLMIINSRFMIAKAGRWRFSGNSIEFDF